MYIDPNTTQGFNLYSTITDAVEMSMRMDLIQKTGAKLLKDGNQWCYIIGDLPEQNCVAGFGDSPSNAAYKFWEEFHNPIK